MLYAKTVAGYVVQAATLVYMLQNFCFSQVSYGGTVINYEALIAEP